MFTQELFESSPLFLIIYIRLGLTDLQRRLPSSLNQCCHRLAACAAPALPSCTMVASASTRRALARAQLRRFEKRAEAPCVQMSANSVSSSSWRPSLRTSTAGRLSATSPPSHRRVRFLVLVFSSHTKAGATIWLERGGYHWPSE